MRVGGLSTRVPLLALIGLSRNRYGYRTRSSSGVVRPVKERVRKPSERGLSKCSLLSERLSGVE